MKNVCGSVGRAVVSNTGGLQFESSHQQNLNRAFKYRQMYRKNENNKIEAGNILFKKLIVKKRHLNDRLHFQFMNDANKRIFLKLGHF